MATHSSIHAWEIPWREEPSGLQSELGMQSQTPLSTHASTHRQLRSCVCEDLGEESRRLCGYLKLGSERQGD